MDFVLGSFAPVAADEFLLLRPLNVDTLAAQLETVRREKDAFEQWLGAPPAGASAEDIQLQLRLWDGCSQWLVAYEEELSRKREAVRLQEEVAEVRGLLAADPPQPDYDRLIARRVALDQRAAELGVSLIVPEPELPQQTPAEQPDTRSWIQRQLDEEWEMANHAGPGCPFCDAIISCDCWARRAEMMEAEERRRQREERATVAARVARGEDACECDDYGQCQACYEEEKARCGACGQLQCKPGCCGECRSCERCMGPPCPRCKDWGDCGCYDDQDERDEQSSCGCGACEEHDWRAEEAWC